MDRRGFLARLTAAAAGMAAAAQSGRLVSAAPLPLNEARRLARPRLDEAQEQVIRLLRKCRVINIEQQMTVCGPTHWRITYRKGSGGGLNDGDKPLPMCNLSHSKILDCGVPVSMVVSLVSDNPPSLHLGQLAPSPFKDPAFEVEVVWLLP